jgi:hypothetical protein
LIALAGTTAAVVIAKVTVWLPLNVNWRNPNIRRRTKMAIVDLAEVRKAKKEAKEKADRKKRIKRIIKYAKSLNWEE